MEERHKESFRDELADRAAYCNTTCDHVYVKNDSLTEKVQEIVEPIYQKKIKPWQQFMGVFLIVCTIGGSLWTGISSFQKLSDQVTTLESDRTVRDSKVDLQLQKLDTLIRLETSKSNGEKVWR